jgi:hypothetical protein
MYQACHIRTSTFTMIPVVEDTEQVLLCPDSDHTEDANGILFNE